MKTQGDYKMDVHMSGKAMSAMLWGGERTMTEEDYPDHPDLVDAINGGECIRCGRGWRWKLTGVSPELASEMARMMGNQADAFSIGVTDDPYTASEVRALKKAVEYLRRFNK